MGETKRSSTKDDGTGAEQSMPQSVLNKPLRPAQCRSYMRRKLASEFGGIVDGFIQGAKSGSCPHVKLATELLESKPRAERKKTGRRTIERWLDEVERGA